MLKNFLNFRKLALILLLSGVFYVIFTEYNKLCSELSKNFVSFPKVTDTYVDIFTKNSLRYLKRDLTFFSKGTNPVATFDDNRDSSRVLAFKFDFEFKPVVMSRHLEVSNDELSVPAGVVYDNTRIINDFDIYRSTEPIKFEKMLFSMQGSQVIVTAQNDSLLCFRGLFKSFSISESSKQHIAMNVKRSSDKIDFSQILFLKKKESIYLLFKEESQNKSKRLDLYNLITN